MQLVKVISVIVPKPLIKGYISPHATYTLVVDYGDGVHHTIAMNRNGYEVFTAEQALLNAGVNAELLSNYHDAVYNKALWDNNENLGG